MIFWIALRASLLQRPLAVTNLGHPNRGFRRIYR